MRKVKPADESQKPEDVPSQKARKGRKRRNRRKKNPTEEVPAKGETTQPKPSFDVWASTYSADREILFSAENSKYINGIPRDETSLEGSLASEEDIIHFFMGTEHARSSSRRKAKKVLDFCLAEQTGTDVVITIDQDPESQDAQSPKIWLEDRNLDFETTRKNKKLLSNAELQELLGEKRWDNPAIEMIDVQRRLIFIGDGDGSSIFALIRTAPPSQTSALRQLFLRYLDPLPQKSIKAEVSSWCKGSFDFNFSLSYYAIGPVGRQDIRTIPGGKGPFRPRHDLPLLSTDHGDIADRRMIDHDPVSLYEANISFTVVGLGDRFWTGVCLKDEFFEEEPRLEPEDQLEEVGGSVDPITFKMVSSSPSSPRAYFFYAVDRNVAHIFQHQKDIQEAFNARIPAPISSRREISQEERKWIQAAPGKLALVAGRIADVKDELDEFLKRLEIGHDGLPKTTMLRSLETEPERSVVEVSLARLKQRHTKLCDIERELQRYIGIFKDRQKELRSQDNDEKNEADTIAQDRGNVQLLFTILNLVAQLYSGRPDNLRERTRFTILIVFNAMFGITALAWFGGRRLFQAWKNMSKGTISH